MQIILHNISLKNRNPKVYTYSLTEIFPDLGGEWMSYNETEISNELKARIELLTGHTDVDFTNKDCLILEQRDGKSIESEEGIQFYEMNPGSN